ncbi:MAG: zf-TFIIB domain-containing protein [Nanoarchaeota archaeon]|nr:zf-TFIIB domain-containing protein [Nanoarchaeota archaeon]
MLRKLFGKKLKDKAHKKIIDKKTGEELLLCPRCRIHMEKLKKKNIILDVCDRCGGMWADFGEIEKLHDIHKREVEKYEKAQRRK